MFRTCDVEQLAELLYFHDPIGLRALGAPPDEYWPEAETIANRLPAATSAADVKRILHEEFTTWFSADIAGNEERYLGMSLELWEVPAN
ncbi:hypothetical protein [Microbacterium sp. 2FI]|uniref:hypothetical protein n=1 Tax=Microbacterium sp. 2FI TaxID=2502193 RepID=UPI001BB1F3EB|nr:hypothetical protein [Microbacterium sp. 2FI]